MILNMNGGTNDPDLIPENIRKGVNICGVEGTMISIMDSFSQRVNSIVCKLQPTVTNGYTIATTYSYDADDTSFGGIYRMNNNAFEWTHPNSSYTNIQYCKSLPNGVVVGLRYYNSASFVYSTDYGKTWSTASIGVTFEDEPVLMSNGSMIAVYGINTSDVYYVAYTTNGSSWTTKNLGTTAPYEYINGDEVSGYFYGGNITTTTADSYYNYSASYYRTKDFVTWEKAWDDVYLGKRSTTASSTHDYTCQGAYQFGDIHLIFVHRLYSTSSNNESGALYFTYSIDGITWYSIESLSDWIDNYGSQGDVDISLASIVYHKDKVYIYHPYYDDKDYCNPEYFVISSSGLTSKTFSGTVYPYCLSSTGDKLVLYYNNVVDYYDEL